MNFLAADVPDPTDFPPQISAPGLRTLDGSFRCDICGELFDAPATISCGHCFCSACIRSALSTKQECPSCRKSAGEGHIRPNPALESVISAWKEARPFVLGLISQEKERLTPGVAPPDSSVSRKRKRSANQSPNVDAPRSSSGPSRHEADLATPKAKSRVSKFFPTSSSSVVPSSDAEEDEIVITGSSNMNPKDNGMVICPMCARKVRFAILNEHMDNECKDPPKATTAANDWSKLLTGGGKNNQSTKKGKQKRNGSDSDDEHPLPLTSYNTLKDRQLRDRLSEHGLPLTGDRSTWERRYRYWTILYNSNLDKSIANRKTKADLKRDLKKWEEDMVKKKKQPAIDPVSYQKTHKSEFKRLIDEAKKSQAKPSPASKLKQSDSSSSQAEPNPQSGSSSGEVANDTIVVDSEDERTGVLR